MPRPALPWGEVPRAEISAPSGILLVAKDTGATSHDVVNAVRRLAATRKVGHAGTLDPLASGLLTLGIGKSTKILRYFTNLDKSYRAQLCLGVATTTEDAAGEILFDPQPGLSPLFQAALYSPDSALAANAALQAALAQFRGEIMQRPSAVSAIKVEGKRAYARVRAGEKIELPARPVVISALEVGELHPGPIFSRAGKEIPTLVAELSLSCSSGTYVRALARDIGASLGMGAHLQALERTRVGTFTLEQAASISEYSEMVRRGLPLPVQSAEAALRTMLPILTVNAAERRALSYGQRISLPPDFRKENQDFAAIYGEELVATGTVKSGKMQLHTVFITPPAVRS